MFNIRQVMSGAILRAVLGAGRATEMTLGRPGLLSLSRTGPVAQPSSALRPISLSCRGGRLSSEKPSGEESNPSAERAGLGEMIKPTDFQKKVLVWGKIYPSIAEVPERVSSSRMKKARDLFRIRVNLLMALATFIGCVLMIVNGRMMRDSGDSLDVRGRAQVEEWKQKGKEEREEVERKRKEGGGGGK